MHLKLQLIIGICYFICYIGIASTTFRCALASLLYILHEKLMRLLPRIITKFFICAFMSRPFSAYMRKFCLESGQPEPPEKSINETFSHQVNYARRKFKRGKVSDVIPAPHDESHQGINDDSFNQSQCQDNNNPPHLN